MNMIAPIRNILLLVVVVLLGACTLSQSKQKSNIELELVNQNDSWGYQIYIDDKLYIKQDMVPAVQGNVAFKNKAEANMVGNLVADKLRAHELPKVELRELRLLGIVD